MVPARRTSTDPLVRSVLRKHKFNLLSVPREASQVYDFYFGSGREIFPPSRFEGIFSVPPKLPDPVVNEEFKLPDQNFSDVYASNVAGNLVAKLFGSYGVSVEQAKVTAQFDAQKAAKAKFRFIDVTRDSVDVLAVHRSLRNSLVKDDMLQLLNWKDLYLVVGVIRAKGLEFIFSDNKRNKVVVDGQAAIEGVLEGELKTTIEASRSATGDTVFFGEKRIAFGAELVEVKLHQREKRESIGDLPPAIDIRNEQGIIPSSRFIGNDEGPIFVNL